MVMPRAFSSGALQEEARDHRRGVRGHGDGGAGARERGGASIAGGGRQDFQDQTVQGRFSASKMIQLSVRDVRKESGSCFQVRTTGEAEQS